MADFTQSVEDNHILHTITFVDTAGSPVNLTTASSVKFQNRSKRIVQEESMTVTDAANGIATIQLPKHFLNIGDNDVGGVAYWGDATESYSTTDYVIKGIKT